MRRSIKKIITRNFDKIPNGYDEMVADEIIEEITKSDVECRPCFNVPWNRQKCPNYLFCTAEEPDDCMCIGCESKLCSTCLMWDQFAMEKV